jgi:30S ribosomal protein S31
MGRGDIKSKKGKIAKGSFGNTRPAKVKKAAKAKK